MKFTSHSSGETENFAKKYIGGVIAARSDVKSGAFVLGLYGNLGSGKTAFTQAIASGLGITEQVTSPTYLIEKIYPLSHSLSFGNPQTSPQRDSSAQDYTQGNAQVSPPKLGDYSTAFTHLIHIDAYRLESADEMKHLGWDEIVANPKNLIVVEWPEKIAPLLPADHARLKFTFVDDTTREIESE
jgi:tRNA threonylcarbamoyladenosine biosynthesis protein TsaE